MGLKEIFNRTKEKKSFSAIDAYTTSSLNKAVSLEEMYQNYFRNIQRELKSKCHNGGVMEKYICHEAYVTKEHKKRLAKDLEDLGYKVLYSGDISMIVSWAHLKEGVNERKKTD